MNASTTDKLHAVLFEQGRDLINIKFFPGTDRGLTAGQLRDAAASALASVIERGSPNLPPMAGRDAVKLENF